MNAKTRKKKKRYLFDNPDNVKRSWRLLYAVCIGLFLIDFVYHRQVIYSWEGLWGFYGLFGFIGIVVLILLAKQLRKLVMREEDYYDVDD